MIWMSERDNWNHLYMYDRDAACPTHQITRGEWYVRDVLKVDEANGRIYFSANGVNSDEDPYFIRYYSIDFDGNNLTDLTPAKGTHKAGFSRDMKYLVDVYSTVADAPVAVLCNAADGSEVMPLETADLTRLKENGWKAPEVFTAPRTRRKDSDVGTYRATYQLRPVKEISHHRVHLSGSRRPVCSQGVPPL